MGHFNCNVRAREYSLEKKKNTFNLGQIPRNNSIIITVYKAVEKLNDNIKMCMKCVVAYHIFSCVQNIPII